MRPLPSPADTDHYVDGLCTDSLITTRILFARTTTPRALPERSEDDLPSYRMTVDLRFAAGGGRGTNTWHFRTGADLSPGTDIDTITGWVEDFYRAVAPVLPISTSATWDGTLSEILTVEPGFVGQRTPWVRPGTAPTGLYTAAAGMGVVTWRSSLASRSGRGRTFVGPLAAGAVQSDGSLEPNALATLRNAGAALVAQSNTNDNVGAIGVFSPTDGVIRDIVAATVTDQVAVLRSRRD